MLLRVWILLCATLAAGGWILSAFRELNAVGYAVILALFVAGIFAGAKFLEIPKPWPARRRLRRFFSWRNPLPLLFAVMAIILLCRGCTIAPFHGDSLSYRIPRILNWLAEGRWYWIDAQDPRLNTRGVDSEWLDAPLLLAFAWDRLMFLPNWISILFFPQLIFQVWRDWGVPGRTARLWMWLLPAGFCYSLQACNASNDIPGTFFALAAFAFLRRRAVIPPADVLCSFLSIALASGVKLTMAPLGIPWLVLVCVRRKWCFRWPWLTFAACAWSALISFVPNVAANLIHVGDATGLSLEPSVFRASPHVDRLVGNVYVILLDNLTIPAMGDNTPVRIVLENLPPGPMIKHQFEKDTLYRYPYFSVEQAGLGVIVLLTGAIVFLLVRHPTIATRWRSLARNPSLLMLHATTWALALSFLWVNTAVQPARLISAYYPYLLATFFVGSTWPGGWRWISAKIVAGLGLVATILCLLFSTDYPLFHVGKSFEEHSSFEKLQVKKLHEWVPDEERNIGMMRFWNEWESWAWQPYGTRRVYELPEDPQPADLARWNIHYVVITEHFLKAHSTTIDAWTASHDATVVGKLIDHLKDRYWGFYVVEITPASQPASGLPPKNP